MSTERTARERRVADIARRIGNGTYRVAAVAVADAIIARHRGAGRVTPR